MITVAVQCGKSSSICKLVVDPMRRDIQDQQQQQQRLLCNVFGMQTPFAGSICWLATGGAVFLNSGSTSVGCCCCCCCCNNSAVEAALLELPGGLLEAGLEAPSPPPHLCVVVVLPSSLSRPAMLLLVVHQSLRYLHSNSNSDSNSDSNSKISSQ